MTMNTENLYWKRVKRKRRRVMVCKAYCHGYKYPLRVIILERILRNSIPIVKNMHILINCISNNFRSRIRQSFGGIDII